MKKILVYGDSNVWGDNFLTRERIPDEKQWVNILQKNMGNDVKVLQEGLPGRIAGDEEKEKPYKNGKNTFLATFRICAPVQIVIIALGTNDLQIKYRKNTKKIVKDLLWYKEIIANEFLDEDNKRKYFKNQEMPHFIYLLPSNFDYQRSDNPAFNKISENKRRKLQNIFKDLKEDIIIINDAALFSDGIHLDYDGHEYVAKIVQKKLKELEG